MIGSVLTRILVLFFGYMYPAYECFKAVERNKPEIENLRFWCQYWILLSVMNVFERFADTFVSWVPMYSEAKLLFIIYLWYPRTKGTTYVYDSFFKPYVSKHETEIDRNLLELRTRAGDMAFMYCQKAVIYGQTRIFEILQYVASQSTPRPRTTQVEQQAPRTRQAPVTAVAAAAVAAVAAAAPPRQPSTKAQATQPQPQTQVEEPVSPASSSTSSSRQEDEMEEDQSSVSSAPAAAPPSPAPSPIRKSVSMPIAPASPKRPATNKAESMKVVTVPAKAEKPEAKSPTAEETVMEETIRVTRGRLRKTRSTVTK